MCVSVEARERRADTRQTLGALCHICTASAIACGTKSVLHDTSDATAKMRPCRRELPWSERPADGDDAAGVRGAECDHHEGDEMRLHDDRVPA